MRMLALVLLSTLLGCSLCSEDFVSLPMKRILLPTREIAQRDGKSIALTHVSNVAYSTTIYVGKYLQPFVVQVDTGSADLFIPSNKCKSCGFHRKFECLAESTETIELRYASGYASGPLCSDQITIGGLTVDNQKFVVAEVVDDFLQSYPFDGILGMGMKEASMSQSESPLQHLFNHNNLSKKVFSVYLTKEDEGESELTIGGANPKYYYGDFSYVPVRGNDGTWEVLMEDFSIGGETIRNCDILPCRAVLDTGNTDISIPQVLFYKVYDILKNAVPRLKEEKTTYFAVLSGYTFHVPNEDIFNLPTIDITVAGKTITLEPEDYKGTPSEVYPEHHEILLTTIPSLYWLLGDIVFRKVYTQFDIGNMRVGFANLI